MNKPFYALLFLITTCHLASCKGIGKEVDKVYESNKSIQKLKVGDMQVAVKMMERYGNSDSKNNTSQTLAGADDYLYFDVRFDKTGEVKLTKEQTLYSIFDIQKDFTVVNNRDSIVSSFCQKIENGIKGRYEYLVAFEKTKAFDEGITLIYKDQVFGLGTIAFEY